MVKKKLKNTKPNIHLLTTQKTTKNLNEDYNPTPFSDHGDSDLVLSKTKLETDAMGEEYVAVISEEHQDDDDVTGLSLEEVHVNVTV